MSDTYNRFYNYSFTNQILLYMQGVNEPVATYKRWQEMDRQVKKGSKAKEIIRPIAYKNKDTEEMEIKGFHFVKCLFGLSETDGEELPPPEIKAWQYYTALNKLGITEIDFTMTNGNIQGYATGKQLAINPVATDKTATQLHEIAHIVLGHTNKENQSEYTTHRGIKEMQAETVAYILQNELYLAEPSALSESRAYIQGWLKDTTVPDIAIKEILRAVDKIIKAGK